MNLCVAMVLLLAGPVVFYLSFNPQCTVLRDFKFLFTPTAPCSLLKEALFTVVHCKLGSVLTTA